MPRGKKLSAVDKEVIVQTYLICQDMKEVERRTGRCYATILKILKEAKQADPELKAARQESIDRISRKVQDKVHMLLDSVTKEDVESGRLPVYDKNGELVGYKHWGPSLSQKAITGGIWIDKVKALTDLKKAIGTDIQSGQMLAPDDVEGLINACRGKIENLSVLNIKFAEDHSDVHNKAQELLEKVEIANAMHEDVVIDDLDGNTE